MKYVSYQEYRQALEQLESTINEFRNNGSGCWSSFSPFVDNSGLLGEKPINIQINWCACGNVPLDKAKQFAEELKQAIKLAEDFEYNGYRIKFEDSNSNK